MDGAIFGIIENDSSILVEIDSVLQECYAGAVDVQAIIPIAADIVPVKSNVIGLKQVNAVIIVPADAVVSQEAIAAATNVDGVLLTGMHAVVVQDGIAHIKEVDANAGVDYGQVFDCEVLAVQTIDQGSVRG
jgi:hypothetical protein